MPVSGCTTRLIKLAMEFDLSRDQHSIFKERLVERDRLGWEKFGVDMDIRLGKWAAAELAREAQEELLDASQYEEELRDQSLLRNRFSDAESCEKRIKRLLGNFFELETFR